MKSGFLFGGFLLVALLTLSVAHAGGPGGRLLCFGGPGHGNLCFDSSSCPGGQCIGGTFCKGGPDTGNLCLENKDCTGGKCVDIGRVGFFSPRVCQSGPDKGAACRADADCDRSACVLNLVKPGLIKAVLTVIVDDDLVGAPASGIFPAPCPGLSTERGTTILLEVTKGGKTHLLSESFRCFIGALGDVGIGFMTWENGLNDAVENASILNTLLFRGTASSTMAQQLRDLFGSTGVPVVVDTTKKINTVKHTNNEGNGLASVVRLDVTLGFLPAE